MSKKMSNSGLDDDDDDDIKKGKRPPRFWSCHTTGKSATGRDGQKASDEGVEQRSSIIASEREREREESKPRAE